MITENEMNRIGWINYTEGKNWTMYKYRIDGKESGTVTFYTDNTCYIDDLGERLFKGFIPDIETLMLVLELVGVNYERP